MQYKSSGDVQDLTEQTKIRVQVGTLASVNANKHIHANQDEMAADYAAVPALVGVAA